MVGVEKSPETDRGVMLRWGMQEVLAPSMGTVIAHGSGRWTEKQEPKTLPIAFPKVGTRVVFVPEHGTTITKGENLPYDEVRVYGSWAEFQSEVYSCNWWSSVVAGNESGRWVAYGSNVLIKPDPMPEKIGSIYMPPVAQRRNLIGTIESCGLLVQDFKVGMRVCYDPHKCHPVQSCDELGDLIPASELAIEYAFE